MQTVTFADRRVAELFFPPGTEGELARIISSVIFLLALSALTALAYLSLRLGAERRALERARRDPDPWRARARDARLPGAALPTPADGGLARRMWEVAKAADAEGSALLTTSDDARVDASPALVFARWVASTLILLGLAGTLVGLSFGVSGLASFFEGVEGAGSGLPDSSGLVAAILEVVGGLRTAFSTTLSGVIGTLALRLALAWVGGRILSYQAELDAFTATVLLPAARPTVDSSVASAADAVVQLEVRLAGISRILEATAGRLDALLGTDPPGGTLAEHAAALKESVEALRSTLVEQKSHSDNLRDQIVGGVKGAAEAVGRSLQVGVDAQVEALRRLGDVKEEEIKASEQLQAFLTKLEPARARLDAFLEALQTAAGQMREAADAEDRVLHTLHKVSNQLAEVTGELQSTNKQMEQVSSASEEFRDVLDVSLSQFGRALKQVAVFDGRGRVAPREE